MAVLKLKTEEIADAVATALEEYFSGAVKRVSVPLVEIGSVKELTLFVSVKGDRRTVVDRSQNRETHTVDVGVYKKVDPNKPEEVTGAQTEVEKLKLLFADPHDPDKVYPHQGELRDSDMAGADWKGMENALLFDQEQLKGGQFASVVMLEYELVR